MKSSSSCCSRGSSPCRRMRRDRRISSPTLMPCTSADAFCTGRQKLCLIFAPASSTASSVPVKIRSACVNCPRSRSAASVTTRSIFCACPRARYTMCEASFTMLEIFGCVSSKRICTRVRIGPTRDCKSVTSRLVFSDVRFSWKNSNVNMITWTTRAMAAMMQNTSSQNCIAAPRVPLGDGTPCYRLTKFLRRLRLAQIRFASGFHCRRDRIFFAYSNFLAALNQFVGPLAQFAVFFLGVFLDLICFLRKKIASFFAGFRRKQNTPERANPHSHHEIRHLRTHIVRHNSLQRNRSIALTAAQCVLTAILIRMRLLGFRIAELAQNFFRVFSRDHATQFFQPSSLNIGDAPEFFQ